MPFRNYGNFDHRTLVVLQKAYDSALVQLGIRGDDPRSGPLAAAIAQLADDGERNADALCAAAIERIGLAGRDPSHGAGGQLPD